MNKKHWWALGGSLLNKLLKPTPACLAKPLTQSQSSEGKITNSQTCLRPCLCDKARAHDKHYSKENVIDKQLHNEEKDIGDSRSLLITQP